MDLTSDELPDSIHGIPIAEIGFSKPGQLSPWHLIVKVRVIIFLIIVYVSLKIINN